jgi:membrane-bound lytic murein transglycosylase D
MLKIYLNKISTKLLSSKKYFIAFGAALAILSILKLFNFSLSDKFSDANFEDYFNTNYKIFSVRIPQNLNFAGEAVPVSDFRIHKAMEEELVKNTYWQSQSLVSDY